MKAPESTNMGAIEDLIVVFRAIRVCAVERADQFLKRIRSSII